MQDDDITGPAVLRCSTAKRCGARLGLRRLPRRCRDEHEGRRGALSGDGRAASSINLEQHRVPHQNAGSSRYESRELLALTAYVARQSAACRSKSRRRRKIAASKPASAIFHRRQGQLNLACAQCHDETGARSSPARRSRRRIRPAIRSTGSNGRARLAQRRLRNCLTGMRAERYAYGAPELVDLELYLMWRARGMKIETPAVRPSSRLPRQAVGVLAGALGFGHGAVGEREQVVGREAPRRRRA